MLGLDEWFDNFTQAHFLSLTKERIATIPNPYLEYSIYWTLKSMQFTCAVGGLLVHPIYRIYKLKTIDKATQTTNTTKIIRNAARRIQGRFILAGIAAGPLIGLFWPKIQGWSRNEVKEQCYDIRTGGDWLVWDRATVCLGFFGWYWKRFQGAVDGVNLALGYALAYHYIIKEKTSVLLVDKYKPEELYDSVAHADASKNPLKALFKTKGLSVLEVKKE